MTDKKQNKWQRMQDSRFNFMNTKLVKGGAIIQFPTCKGIIIPRGNKYLVLIYNYPNIRPFTWSNITKISGLFTKQELVTRVKVNKGVFTGYRVVDRCIRLDKAIVGV